MKRKKDYKQKIVFHSNRLHEGLNAAPSEYNSENIKRSLESLNYFVKRQLQINNGEEIPNYTTFEIPEK
tara:strand:+ start:496 stop:702 length:207 start_codon:yes stop_codon:yes gene_type:complete